MSLSIKEYKILSIVETALLKSTVTNDDSERNNQLFISTLATYSSLRQVPKFFVKLFLFCTDLVKNNQEGKALKRGQIVPATLQASAKCISELPPGQTIELWEIFNESFCALQKLTVESPKAFGALFYVSQLFSTFLLHARIFDASLPKNIHLKVDDMIQNTTEILNDINFILKKTESEIIPCQISVLMICYAVTEVRVTYNILNISPKLEFPTLELQKQILDFSLIYPFLNDDHANAFLKYLDSEDKCQSYYLIQILIQKIRILKLKRVLVKEEKDHLHSSIEFLIQFVTLLISDNVNGTWDTDLSTLDNHNYGTAMWITFLKFIPFISDSLNYKQTSLICNSMFAILLESSSERIEIQSGIDARSRIHNFFKSEIFQESINLQTALVSCLWKHSTVLLKTKKRAHDSLDADATTQEKVLNELSNFHSKWAKYISTGPSKYDDGAFNSLWITLRESSTQLQRMLKAMKQPQQLKILETEYFLKLLDYLPLEYLEPGNQMRCLIGLSVLFFSSPHSGKNLETNQLAERISKLLMATLETSRSIWLFDFVDCGLYLKAIVTTLDVLNEKSSGTNSHWIKKLLERLISFITGSVDRLKSSEEFFQIENVTESISTALAALIFLQKIVLIFQQHSLATRYQKEDYRCAVQRIVSSISCSITKLLKNKCEQKIDSNIYVLVISCFGELISFARFPMFNLEEKECSKWMKQIPAVLETVSLQISEENELADKMESYLLFLRHMCLHHKELSSYLPNDFFNVTWKIISIHLRNKCNAIRQRMHQESSVHSAITVSKSQSAHHLCPRYFSSAFEENSQSLSILTLSSFELDVLHTISKTASDNEIKEILDTLQADIEMSSLDISGIDVISFQMKLLAVINLISSAQERGERSNISISHAVQKILYNLHYIASQSCGSSNCLLALSLPILELYSFTVKKSMNGLCLPKQTIIQGLHLCIGIGINNTPSDPALFVKVFKAMFNFMNDLRTCHHDVATTSAAYVSFLSVLLKSIVKAGNQDILEKHSESIKQEVVTCAQNIEKLLTRISLNKEEFFHIAPYLIADYIDTVQYITVYPPVKDHILLGINRLLEVCDEGSLRTLSVNLNDSCREIYSNLVKNYKHYRQYV